MYLTFVVKGTERIALEEMKKRGIGGYAIGYTRTDTVFKTDIRNREKVADWFNEPEEIKQGYGYPDGSLLIYSTHEERE